MSFVSSLRARARARQRRIVLAEGCDARVLDAVVELVGERIAQPILVGDEVEVRDGLESRGVAADGVEVLDPAAEGGPDRWLRVARETPRGAGMSDEELVGMIAGPVAVSALAVASGRADGCVAGVDHPTAEVLRQAIRWIGLAPGISTVSSCFFMVVPPFREGLAQGGDTDGGGEVLTFTDGGVIPDPTSEQLAEIADAAVAVRARIVGDEPKVAFLSYSTHGSASGPGVDRVREGLRLFRERARGVPADGELQADAALIPAVARRKVGESPVAGAANILVFPDLDAANIAYKLVERLAGATALGPVIQGLRRPMNDLSRGASVPDVVEVVAITSLMAG